VYHGSLSILSWIAVAIVIFSSLRYVLRYVLLGISDAKSVLIINSTGAALQLAVGYSLVSIGFGALGILVSFLVNVMFVTIISFITARRRSFELFVGSLTYAREILNDALINMPAPLAKTFIFSLSVVLLAFFGISQSNVGTFYIALMVSFIAGGFAGNIAFMIIPISSNYKRDLSAESIRIGLTLTVPLIVALMVVPKSILSIIGSAYASADIILLVLSAAIFPYIIVTNAISKFNNLSKPKKIIAIGSVQLLSFLLSFLFLVPQYGTLGAALSILVACTASALASIVWSERLLLKQVTRCFLPLVCGLVSGYLLKLLFVSINPAITISLAVAVTLVTIFGLKITSAKEIVVIAKAIMRQN
jgi:O-antigen/teichoic acid export membrane protein